jgi:hypothetical protein
MSGSVSGWPGTATPASASLTQSPIMISPDQRQALLSQHVQMAVARGARVQHADAYGATVVYGKAVNHVLHAILTLFLLGIWLFVWIPLAIFGGEKRELIRVDDFGRVTTQKV